MILLDTSIWVSYLRGRAHQAEVEDLLEERRVATCGPVAAELVQGFPEGEQRPLWRRLRTLAWARLGQEAWYEAGVVAGRLRRGGTGLPLVDVAIAVAALELDAELWTRDRHFERLAVELPRLRLRLERP